MKIHCLYRDFFLFLKAIEIEESKWHCFKEYYFSKYRDFLSIVWYKLQGFTQKNIKERVNSIRKEDYSDLEAGLKVYDIEDNTRKIIDSCRKILYFPEICNIYLFIGFFSPDAFVFKFGKKFVIAVGLERFHDFRNYPVLLAHEYCHYVQDMMLGESQKSVKDRILREGISIYFSSLVYPNKKPWEYLFIDREKYYQLEEKYSYYIDILKHGGFENKDIFHGITHVDNDSFYPRIGYFIGYKLIKDFVGEPPPKDFDFAALIEDKEGILKYY